MGCPRKAAVPAQGNRRHSLSREAEGWGAGLGVCYTPSPPSPLRGRGEFWMADRCRNDPPWKPVPCPIPSQCQLCCATVSWCGIPPPLYRACPASRAAARLTSAATNSGSGGPKSSRAAGRRRRGSARRDRDTSCRTAWPRRSSCPGVGRKLAVGGRVGFGRRRGGRDRRRRGTNSRRSGYRGMSASGFMSLNQRGNRLIVAY